MALLSQGIAAEELFTVWKDDHLSPGRITHSENCSSCFSSSRGLIQAEQGMGVPGLLASVTPAVLSS